MDQLGKQKMVLKIIIVLVLLLVITIGGVFAYVSTDLFKTPDQLFKKYLLSSLIEVTNFNIDPYRDTLERMNEENTEITANQKMIITNLDDTGEQISVDSTEKFIIDPVNQKSAIEIDIKGNDKNFFNMSLLGTGETFGVYIPELHEKYLAVENRDLKKLFQTLGADEESLAQVPDKIEMSATSEEEKEKLLNLGSKYIEKIAEQIDETLYTKESYKIDDFDGKSFKGNKYTLAISEVDLMNILINIYKELLEDPEFLALMEGKIENAQLEELKTEFSELEPLEADEETGNITMSFYEANGKSLRFEIITSEGDTTQITLLNQKTSSHLAITQITPKTEYNDVAYETTYDITNTFENNYGEFWIKTAQTYNKEDLAALKEENESENSYFSSFYDEEYYETRYSDESMAYKISTTVEGDVIKSNIAIDGVEQEYYTLNESTITVRSGKEVEVPTLNQENSLVINDYTKEDFSKLGTEIVTNVMKSVEENPESLFGAYYSIITGFSGGLSIDSQDTGMDSITDSFEEAEWLTDATVTDNVAEEDNDTVSNVLNEMVEQEIDAFNSQFTSYEGEDISGSMVKSLFSKLNANISAYAEDPTRVPSIIFENDVIVYMDNNTSAYTNAINSSRMQIENKKNYKVEALYDDETGIVTTIIIEKVNDTVE